MNLIGDVKQKHAILADDIVMVVEHLQCGPSNDAGAPR